MAGPRRNKAVARPTNGDPLHTGQASPRMWIAGGMGLLVAMIIIAYMPAMRGQFVWDDDAHVTKPELRSAHGLYRIWFDVGATQQYYPLLHSAFWVEHKLWGDWPTGYHLVNLIFHAFAAVLVMLIVRRLLQGKAVGWADEGAFLTAAVFALHPVHVESVAWITEQKNTLSAVFYLGAMLTYLRFDEERRSGAYALTVMLFLLGLLTKTVVATLPAALLVILWWQRGRLAWRRDVLPLLPWFLFAATGGVFTAWVEHELIGAKGEAFGLSWVQRLVLSGQVVWFYLAKLVWPANLTFIYPRWAVSSASWSQWLFPAGLALLLIVAAAVSRVSRAPLAAMLFFIGSLFPVLGFLNVYPFLYSYVADHFQYLPSLGVIALICCSVAAVVSGIPRPMLRAPLLLALPIILGVLTFRQCGTYSDSQGLYEAIIQKNPTCWMAYNNLGIIHKREGRSAEAIECYRRAIELRRGYPEAYNNLGIALNSLGRYDEAVAAYREAIRLRPVNPEALGNLAVALTGSGRPQEAISVLQNALRYDAENAGVHRNLGVALQAAGRLREAVTAYRRSLDLNPNQPEVQTQLDLANAGSQTPEQAIGLYERLLHDHPENADVHFALAVALAQTGRQDAAIEHYRRAVQTQPKHFEAHSNLAATLAHTGRLPEALPHFEEAARLRPDRIEAQMNLATAYSNAGRNLDALATAQRALDLARSGGDAGLVQKIESWMEASRARGTPTTRSQ